MNLFFLFKTFGIFLLFKISKEDKSAEQLCGSAHETWTICKNLTSILFQEIPNSIVFLEFTLCSFGPILRPTEVTKLSGFKNLRSLYFTYNQLEAIEDTTFAGLTQLTSLDISGNRIRGFREGTFTGLRELIYLYANENLLQTIEPNTFASIPLIQFLDLERNNLTRIGTEFATLRSLSTLLLANNQIIYIDSYAFLNLSNLWHLSLLGNRLSIPKTTWFNDIISNDGTLELSHRTNLISDSENPWVCCSNISEYRDFVLSQKSTLRSYSQLNIKCSAPPNLFARRIKTLRNEEINTICPKQTFIFAENAYSDIKGAFSEVMKKLKSKKLTTAQPSVSTTIIYYRNILSYLTNAEIILIFALFAVFGGAFVAIVVCLISKRSKQKEDESDISELTNNQKSLAKATTRLYRQNVPTYGMTDPVWKADNNFWNNRNRQFVVSREVLTSPEVDDSIIPKSLEAVHGDYPVMEADKSDEEQWTAVNRSNSKTKR